MRTAISRSFLGMIMLIWAWPAVSGNLEDLLKVVVDDPNPDHKLVAYSGMYDAAAAKGPAAMTELQNLFFILGHQFKDKISQFNIFKNDLLGSSQKSIRTIPLNIVNGMYNQQTKDTVSADAREAILRTIYREMIDGDMDVQASAAIELENYASWLNTQGLEYGSLAKSLPAAKTILAHYLANANSDLRTLLQRMRNGDVDDASNVEFRNYLASWPQLSEADKYLLVSSIEAFSTFARKIFDKRDQISSAQARRIITIMIELERWIPIIAPRYDAAKYRETLDRSLVFASGMCQAVMNRKNR